MGKNRKKKWRKQIRWYLIFVMSYVLFSAICKIVHCRAEDCRIWIYGVWYFLTFAVWLATAAIWILLLRKI